MTDSLPVLLHAAARGARIIEKFSYEKAFIQAEFFPSNKIKDCEWRIHPDDQRLRYGPISLVLFDAASTGKTMAGIKEHDLIEWYVPILKGELPSWEIPEEDRQWFFLMLAEELVWSGL